MRISCALVLLVVVLSTVSALPGCSDTESANPAQANRPLPSVDEQGGQESNPKLYYDRTLAIIVGINEYRGTGWQNLERATNDAQAVSRVLQQEFGYAESNIKLLLNRSATKASMMSALTSWLREKRVQTNDAVLIFFAGHGEQGYVIPSDADKSSIADTAISIEWIKEQLQRSSLPCRHKILILDSCYSGTLFKQASSTQAEETFTDAAGRSIRTSAGTRGAGWQEDTLAAYVRGPAFLGISAGRDTVVVDEQGENNNSLFTSVLLKVLAERANSSRPDHIFFGSRLASEVEERVANARGSRQRPKWGYLEPGDGDFVFRPTTRRSTPREVSEDRRKKLKVRRYVNNLRSAKTALDQDDLSSAAQLLTQAIEDDELAARFEARFLLNLAGPNHEQAIHKLSGWSPTYSVDGSRLALSRHGSLLLFEYPSAVQTAELNGHEPVSFIHRNSQLIARQASGSHILLDTASDNSVSLDQLKDQILAVSRSADGTTLAIVTDRGVSVWDTHENLRLRHRFGEPEYSYTALALSTDGSLVAVAENVPYNLAIPRLGIRERRIVIIDTVSGSKLGTIAIERYGVSDLKFSPIGNLLAVAIEPIGYTGVALSPSEVAELRQVRLYDVTTQELVDVLDGFRAGNQALAFSPDGFTLAVGGNPNADLPLETTSTGSSHESHVAFFDLWSAREIYRIQVGTQSEAGVIGLQFLPDNNGLLICERSGTFLCRAVLREELDDWNDLLGKTMRDEDPPLDKPRIFQVEGTPLSLDSSGQLLQTMLKVPKNSEQIAQWNVRTGKMIRPGESIVRSGGTKISYPRVADTQVSFEDLGLLDFFTLSMDRSVVVGWGSGWFYVFDAETGNQKLVFDGPFNEDCSCLEVNHDGSQIITGHKDGSLLLWDVAVRAPVHKFSGTHRSPVTCAAFTDSGEIVSASSEGVVEVRPVPTIERSIELDDFYIDDSVYRRERGR